MDRPSEHWQTLTAWSLRLVRDIDLDGAERNDKLAAAGRLTDAVITLDAGDTSSPALVKTALAKDTNVVARQMREPFVSWLDSARDRAAAALTVLRTDPTPSGVDTFLAEVPDEVLHGTGVRLGVASLLLSAFDPTGMPPWRANTVEKGYRLIGYSKPEPQASDGERYDTFLVFLDLVVEAAAEAGVELRDRLDAQGLLWALIHALGSAKAAAGMPGGERRSAFAGNEGPDNDPSARHAGA